MVWLHRRRHHPSPSSSPLKGEEYRAPELTVESYRGWVPRQQPRISMTRSSNCFKKHWVHGTIVSDIRCPRSNHGANDFEQSVFDIVEEQRPALALVFLPEEVVFKRGVMGAQIHGR